MITQINTFLASSKWRAAILLVLIVVPLSMGLGTIFVNQFYFGINELLTERDVQTSIRYGFGGLGIVQAGVATLIWTTVFTAGAGLVAGAVVAV